MPTLQTDSLMLIAKDSGMRVHQRIERILGEDKSVSSHKEASAILAIPVDEITFFEGHSKLSLARMDATHYLKYGDKNLRDYSVEAFEYLKKKGNELYTKIYDYLSNNRKIALKSSK